MATAFLLVDAQRNMLEGAEAVPAAAVLTPALGALLQKARAARAVVVHVQNDGSAGDPDEPETPGWELVFAPAAGETVLRKDESDAFAANADLATSLRTQGVDSVVVAGLQSEFCIQATTLGARREGFAVFLPRGAHATYGADAAQVSASIEQELATEGVRVVDLAAVEF
jgi:nicotinamidase-related amidase